MEEPGAEVICVVANVAEETAHGEGGLEVRRGVSTSRPGRRSGCCHRFGGTAASTLWSWATTAAPVDAAWYDAHARRHLTGFRVQPVYRPAVVRELTRPTTESSSDFGPGMRATRKEAEEVAERWRDYPLEARLDGRTYTAVSDPPPQELSRGGRTYYLAHFNAYRAIYSAEPPAEEIQLPGE